MQAFVARYGRVMDPSAVTRATAAATKVVAAEGLRVDEVVLLHDSNRVTLHLHPADVVARVAAPSHRPVATREVQIARRLADVEAPIGALDHRFESRVHEHGGFVVTLWAACQPVGPSTIAPTEFAGALDRLHDRMRAADLFGLSLPSVLDRVAEAEALLDDPTNNPAIDRSDRELLTTAIEASRRAIVESEHQPIHGEPHPGNVIRTSDGLLFVDFESCCRGPIEFDLAHAAADASAPPLDVAAAYRDADGDLVRQCWILGLALATAWRCDPDDDLPDGMERARGWLSDLRRSLA